MITPQSPSQLRWMRRIKPTGNVKEALEVAMGNISEALEVAQETRQHISRAEDGSVRRSSLARIKTRCGSVKLSLTRRSWIRHPHPGCSTYAASIHYFVVPPDSRGAATWCESRNKSSLYVASVHSSAGTDSSALSHAARHSTIVSSRSSRAACTGREA